MDVKVKYALIVILVLFVILLIYRQYQKSKSKSNMLPFIMPRHNANSDINISNIIKEDNYTDRENGNIVRDIIHGSNQACYSCT